jgi:hypothetical protein
LRGATAELGGSAKTFKKGLAENYMGFAVKTSLAVKAREGNAQPIARFIKVFLLIGQPLRHSKERRYSAIIIGYRLKAFSFVDSCKDVGHSEEYFRVSK